MKVYSQLEKAQLENTTSDVGSLPKGMITYRTDLNLSKVSNGTSMIALLDESSTQTLTNKTLTDPVFSSSGVFTEITTPSTPAAGFRKIYAKSDGFYQLNSSGVESSFSGGGGANTTLSNLTSPVSFNQPLIPDADGTRDIGTALKKVGITYTDYTFSQEHYSLAGTALVNLTTPYLGKSGAPSNPLTPITAPDGKSVLFWGDGNLNLTVSNSGARRVMRFYNLNALGYNYVEPSDGNTTGIRFRLPPTEGAAGRYFRTDGTGITSWVSPVFVQAANSSGQAINNGTPTTITNWTENIDNYSAFNPTTGTFTVPAGEAGLYLISLHIAWADTTAAGDRVIEVLKSGVTQLQNIRSYETRAGGQDHQVVTILLDLAVGNTITTAGTQSSGGTQNLSATALSNSLSILKVGVL